MGCNNRTSLELRFADQKGVLKIDVAQALDSATSGAVLEFQLFTDARLSDSELVKFNSQGHLEANLTGVSAVRLEVRRHPSGTTCNATAVVTEMSVAPGARGLPDRAARSAGPACGRVHGVPVRRPCPRHDAHRVAARRPRRAPAR